MRSTLGGMSRRKDEVDNPLHQMRRKLLVLKMTSLVLFLALVVSLTFLLQNRPTGDRRPFTERPPSGQAPRYDEIVSIIQPFRYSFMPVLSRPNVKLSVDFKSAVWYLHNIHLFDAQGQLRLEQGRYGLCGDLAAFTYQKVKPLLDEKYLVRFARAAESNFFPAPLNTHFVLTVVSRLDPQEIYILDPSFHRYGPLKEFDNYLFFEHLSTLRFYSQKSSHNVEVVNRAVPVLIENDTKFSLIVKPESDRFDSRHYAVAILTTHKNMYMPRTIYKVAMNDGKRSVSEDAEEEKRLLDTPEYVSLKKIVNQFFDNIPNERNP